MGPWDSLLELLSAVFFSAALALLVLYILSVSSAFAQYNLHVVRASALKGHEDGGEGDEEGEKEEAEETEGSVSESETKRESGGETSSSAGPTMLARLGEGESQESGGESAEPKDEREEPDSSGDEGDEDWEGIQEVSEVEERFTAAATLVATMAASTPPSSSSLPWPQSLPLSQGSPPQTPIGEGLQLMLYSLYKQATVGPCTTKQPSLFSLKAKAKWDAWKSLGLMGSEEAMERYTELVAKLSPQFAQGLRQPQGTTGRGGGKSVSTLGLESSAEGEGELGQEQGQLAHLAARGQRGELEAFLQQPECSINETDEEGRTALHWAADRGQVENVRLLLGHGAQVDAQDGEGQTALHYAALCEHGSVAKLLLEHGASTTIEDNEAVAPAHLLPKDLLPH